MNQVVGSFGTWEALIGGVLLIVTAIMNPEGIAGALRTQSGAARLKKQNAKLAKGSAVSVST
jgi:hypothetical protein